MKRLLHLLRSGCAVRRFSAAGDCDLTTRGDGRRLKSAKARNRGGEWCDGSAAGLPPENSTFPGSCLTCRAERTRTPESVGSESPAAWPPQFSWVLSVSRSPCCSLDRFLSSPPQVL